MNDVYNKMPILFIALIIISCSGSPESKQISDTDIRLGNEQAGTNINEDNETTTADNNTGSTNETTNNNGADVAINNDAGSDTSGGNTNSAENKSTLYNITSKRTADSYNAVWSPDGHSIIFTGITSSGSLGLFKVNADGMSLVEITNDLDHDYVNLPGRSWCEKNDRLVISTDRADHDDIWIVDSNGENWQQITNDSAMDWEPSWSNDCEWIAFQSKSDKNWDINKIKTDGSSLTRITTAAAKDWEPNWSPTGEWIVFQSDTGNMWQLYLIRPDGSGLEALTPSNIEATDPSWSLDGTRVIYSSDAESSNSEDIFIIDIVTGETLNITDSAGYEGAPSFSPDGKAVAFEADWNGKMDIWILQF